MRRWSNPGVPFHGQRDSAMSLRGARIPGVEVFLLADGITVTDAHQDGCLLVNPAFTAITGCAPDDVPGARTPAILTGLRASAYAAFCAPRW